MLMNTPYAVGAAVRGARTRLGLSRAELGRRAGLSLNSVQMLEAGTSNPTLDTLLRVTAVLGLELSAQPSAAGPLTGELPRSAPSRRRGDAMSRRHSSEKAEGSPRVTAAPAPEESPSVGVAGSESTSTPEQGAFDLDAHLESFTRAPFDA